jgi:hypothetical protein
VSNVARRSSGWVNWTGVALAARLGLGQRGLVDQIGEGTAGAGRLGRGLAERGEGVVVVGAELRPLPLGRVVRIGVEPAGQQPVLQVDEPILGQRVEALQRAGQGGRLVRRRLHVRLTEPAHVPTATQQDRGLADRLVHAEQRVEIGRRPGVVGHHEPAGIAHGASTSDRNVLVHNVFTSGCAATKPSPHFANPSRNAFRRRTTPAPVYPASDRNTPSNWL